MFALFFCLTFIAFCCVVLLYFKYRIICAVLLPYYLNNRLTTVVSCCLVYGRYGVQISGRIECDLVLKNGLPSLQHLRKKLCCVGGISPKWTLLTRYTLQRNTASIMKSLFLFILRLTSFKAGRNRRPILRRAADGLPPLQHFTQVAVDAMSHVLEPLLLATRFGEIRRV